MAATSIAAPTSQVLPLVEHTFESGETIQLEAYEQQKLRWPALGHHILGSFTDTSILVYQAFNNEIADYAIREQKFYGAPGFSATRMTWVKSNFLWMMYRSNWARSPNQERILGIWLKLDAFHELLSLSEQTSANSAYASKHEWEAARAAQKTLPGSTEPWNGRVNIQWDPDHHPSGTKLTRRAIQIGIKNVPWWSGGSRFEKIIDFTPLVIAQRDFVSVAADQLYTPHEKVYMLPDAELAKHAHADSTAEDLQAEATSLQSLAK